MFSPEIYLSSTSLLGRTHVKWPACFPLEAKTRRAYIGLPGLLLPLLGSNQDSPDPEGPL